MNETVRILYIFVTKFHTTISWFETWFFFRIFLNRKKLLKKIPTYSFKGEYPPENRFLYCISERETIQKYVLEILLRNSKNWLSYNWSRRAGSAEKKNKKK